MVRPMAHMLIEIVSLVLIIIGAILMGTAEPAHKAMDYFPICVVFAVVCLLNVVFFAVIEVQSRHKQCHYDGAESAI